MNHNILFKTASIVSITVMLLITAMAGTSFAEEKTYNWKLGQPYPKDTIYYQLTEDLIQQIQAESNGRIKITHYPGSLLGDYTAQAEAVANGSQEMVLTWPTTNVAGPGADLSLMGYLFHDWDDYTKGMTGWMFDLHKEMFKNIDWQLLGTLPDGFLVVVSKKEFNPMPGPKDIKIRLMPTETVQERFKALGFRTLSLPMSEFVTALNLGAVDAGGNAGWGEAWYNYKESIEYVYNSRDMTATMFLIINKTLFSSLSEADQKMLSKIGLEWSKNNYSRIMNENNKFREELIKYGTKIVDYSDDEWKANRKVSLEKEWPLMEKRIGKEVMDIVRKNTHINNE